MGELSVSTGELSVSTEEPPVSTGESLVPIYIRTGTRLVNRRIRIIVTRITANTSGIAKFFGTISNTEKLWNNGISSARRIIDL